MLLIYKHTLTLNNPNFVIPAYDFASALALSKSECPCGAQAGIHFKVLKSTWIPACAGMTMWKK